MKRKAQNHPNTLLISIHPEYAKKIFEGTKRVELRRIQPKIFEDDLVVVYVTSPVKRSFGAHLQWNACLSNLWNNYGGK